MSGIMLNIISAGIGGTTPVGILAAIRNPNNVNLTDPRIAIRSDQLNLTVNTEDGSPSVKKLITSRLSLDLAFTWQKSLSNDAAFPAAYDLAIDSSGNVIVVGTIFDSGLSLTSPYVVTFNSSGTVQWQRRIISRIQYNGVAVDSSDNIYAVGSAQLFTPGRFDIYAVKYDASGTIQYQRNIGDTGASANEFGYSVALPNNSVFAVAGESLEANIDATLWILEQSTGATSTATNQRDAGGSGTQQGVAVTKGETDDILYYVVRTFATLSTASKCTQVLLKYSTVTGFVWQRFFADPGTDTLFVGDLCMSPDNSAIYVVATRFATGISGRGEIQITKWDTSGSLVWQRAVVSPTASLNNPNIAVDSLDNIYVSFASSDPSLVGLRTMVLKMPGSGAGSGGSAVLEGVTYNYTTSARTASVNSLTIASQTRPNTAQTQTAATPAATSVDGALAVSSGPI